MEVPLKKQEIRLKHFFGSVIFNLLHKLRGVAFLPSAITSRIRLFIFRSIHSFFGRSPKDFRGPFPKQIEPKYRAAAPFFELYQCMGGKSWDHSGGQGSRGCR